MRTYYNLPIVTDDTVLYLIKFYITRKRFYCQICYNFLQTIIRILTVYHLNSLMINQRASNISILKYTVKL